MARRPDGPSRRELAFAIPLLPLLGRRGPFPGFAPAGASESGPGYATAILLRHAEKVAAIDPKDPSFKDPAISEAGRERARALKRLLGRAGVSHCFASEFRRTRETLAPLAEARSLEIQVVPAADLEGLADRIRKLPEGSVSVVAGHSNTIPALAEALGGKLEDLVSAPEPPKDPRGAKTPVRPSPAMLRDEEYSRIFVLTLRAVRAGATSEDEGPEESRASVLELAYGT